MPLILRVVLAAMALLSCGAALAGYQVGPEPGWVRVDAVPDASDAQAGADGTRYLLVVDQVNLTGARPAWHRRVSYVIGDERGLADAGRFSVHYQPGYQSVALHQVQVWRNGVASERRDAVSVQDLRREADLESGILDGQHTLDITIPDLKVGDRIDYSYTIEGFNPVFGDAYYDVYTATYSDPVALRRVRAIHPASKPLYWKVTREEYAVESGAVGNDARFVDISARNLSRVRADANSPSGYDDYGRIELSTADEWADIVRWSLPLYPVGFSDRAVADALVAELKLHDADKLAAAQRAIAFVQGQVRYTALDMGENSHAPNRPETTLARRFGDCKDKTLLLASLLHEAGISAEPVLVNTVAGARLAERQPGGYAFDHVVARAMIDGQVYWIDATRDRETGPLAARTPLPFKAGLPVCEGCGSLVAIPYPMPAAPEVVVGERIELRSDNAGYAADFAVVTDYTGSRGRKLRNDFADEGAAEFGRRYLRYMRGYYEGITSAAEPSIEQRGDGAQFRTSERYRLGWKSEEGSVFGIVLFQLLDYVPTFDDAARKAPIALGGPRFAEQSVRTSYTKGWSIDAETDRVANDYFDFSRKVVVEDGDLVIEARWKRLADEVPAADVATVGADLAKVRDLLQYNVDLDVTQLPAMFASPRNWAWPLLAFVLAPVLLVLAYVVRGRSLPVRMLFEPSATMTQVLEAPGRPGRMWLLLALAGLAEGLFTAVPEFAQKGVFLVIVVAVVAAGALVLRSVIYTGVFGWALRAVRVRAEFDPLLASTAWGMAPALLLFSLLAVIAVGGDLTVFGAGDPPMDRALQAIVAGLLVVVGSLWALANMLSAHAVAAGTTRGRVLGAWGVLMLVPLLLLCAYVLLT